ncbi:MAG TPA: hypothetical protein VFF06_13245 [Polyangia bacterium]|nr:hypothetical protein [Polyangia bacterium]
MLARRAFVAAWIAASIAGALDHTIAESLFGRRFDLVLPHLKYGHVMFNKNPRKLEVYSYAGTDGVRHDLADLQRTPAPLYKRARVALDVMLEPDYLAELCFRAARASAEPLTLFIDEYDLDAGARPQRTRTMPCDAHALLAR